MANALILIVDADAKSRGVLEVSLKKAGYRLQLFDRARDALAWLEDGHGPDLIISNTSLPAMNGFDFCARVKENLDWESLPFLFLTDANSSDAKRRGFELGVEDYLTRPIYVKEVTTRVQLLLQRREKDLLAMADAEEISGEIEDMTLIDLLQTLEEHRRTAVLEAEREDKRGVLYCRDGRVVDAAVGKLRGAPAVYRLMQWAEGQYTLRHVDSVRRRDRVGVPTKDLLIEGMQQLDKWSEIAADTDLDLVYEVNYRKLADHLRDLPDEVNAVIRLFDGHRTVQDVIDDSPLTPLDTLNVIEKLTEQGMIHDVTPEQKEQQLAVLSGSPDSLSNWLGTEAAETVGNTPSRKTEGETEAQKVQRRREERKRRKLEARKKQKNTADLAVPLPLGDEEIPRVRISNANLEVKHPSNTNHDEPTPEELKLQEELAELTARAEAIRQETEELARQKEARKQSKATQAPLAVAPPSPESLRLKARLAAAEQKAADLAAQREELRRELEAMKEAEEIAEREAAEEAARLEAERKAAEEAARLEAERKAAEEAERKAAEEAAKLEAERQAAAEAAKLEAERKAAEEAERRVAEEVARFEEERKALEDATRRAKEAAALKVAEETAKLEAARQALEDAKREADEKAAKLEAERVAAEEAAKLEAERKAAEEAAKLEAERKAAEEAAKLEAERKAAEEAAKLEAERKALEEATQKAREETARLEAERKALEEAAKEAEAAQKEEKAAEEEAKTVAVLAPEIKEETPKAEDKEEPKAKEEDKKDEEKPAAVAPAPSPDLDEDDAFFRDGDGDSAWGGDDVDPAPAGNNRSLIVGVVAILLIALVGGGIYVSNNNKKNKKPTKPGIAKVDAKKDDAKKDDDKADAKKDDNANSEDKALAGTDAENDPDAEPVDPEDIAAAVGKARELIWEVGLLKLADHPETGEPMIFDGEGEPPGNSEEAVAKNTGANPGKTKPGGGRKPVANTEVPAASGPDPVKIDNKASKKEFSKHLKAGQRAVRARQFDKAIAELRQADAIQGGSSQVNYLLGVSYYNKGNARKALPYLERAVRLNGSNANAVRMLGDAYQASGKRSKAIDAYKKYLALKPTGKASDDIRRILAQYR